jgi:hypothetical protein
LVPMTLNTLTHPDFESQSIPHTRTGLLAAAGVIAGLAVVTTIAIHRLGEFTYFPHGMDWRGAIDGIWPLLPQTGWAALKVWAFWGWGAVVIAGLLLSIDPALGLCDAILAGAAGLWAFAYILGNVLGPIGLFRAPVIWTLMAAGTLWLWRHRPNVNFGLPSPGQTLTILALAILMLLMLPVQLGSPLVPFADALSWPSSAQRILTFHVYTPFDSNPYGLWGAFGEAPGFELFCAMLALGSHTQLALLAESAAMVPFAALVILSLYRLGRTLFDDTGGGFAALLLFGTSFPRLMQSVRPSLGTLGLVGLGLAFFLDSRRDRSRIALGALLLGASIPAHVIDGAVAMAVAAGGVALWRAAGDRSRFGAGTLCLVGAFLVGAPEFPVGLVKPLPYPILPLAIIAGIAIILIGASMLSHEAPQLTPLPRALDVVAVAILALLLATQRWMSLPMPLPLTILALAGLVLVSRKPSTGATHYVALAAAALSIGLAATSLGPLVDPNSSGSGAVVIMLFHFLSKLAICWSPYALTMFAAAPFALVYSRWSRPIALFGVMTVLIYPWNVTDPDQPGWFWHFQDHSLVENLAFDLDLTSKGYWEATSNRRWSLGAAGFDLIAALNGEIRAGRITPATHVVHLARHAMSSTFVQYAAFTGINDDPFEVFYDPRRIFHANSRVRPMRELAAALAKKPPYILNELPLQQGAGFAGYDQLFNEGNLYLFRRHDLAP